MKYGGTFRDVTRTENKDLVRRDDSGGPEVSLVIPEHHYRTRSLSVSELLFGTEVA